MSAAIQGFVERPVERAIAPEQVTRSGELYVAGWALAEGGRPLRVRARIGDATPVEAPVEGLRDDLAARHPELPRAACSGFDLLVPLPAAPGEGGEARLVVEVRDGARRALLADRPLALPARGVEAGAGAPLPRRTPLPRRAPGPRRVLLVGHGYELGGAALWLLELARGLDPARFAPRAIAPIDGPLRAAWRDAGIEAELRDAGPAVPTPDEHAARVRRVAALEARARPDLVVANTLEAFWAVDLASELGAPVLWAVHESVDPVRYFHWRWPTPVAEHATRALARAERLIFVSRATAARFADAAPADRSCVIPGGADLERIDRVVARTSPAEARRALGLPSERPLLLCVGAPCARKGQLVLLAALAALARRRPPPLCVLLGARAGPYLDALRAAAARLGLGEAVRLVDETPDPLPWYRAADLCACPSFQESLPRAVLEAMAFARPLVASRVDGIPELIREGREGLLVPPGDPAALAGALERLLADPHRAAALGTAARRRVEARFPLAASQRATAALLGALLPGGCAP